MGVALSSKASIFHWKMQAVDSRTEPEESVRPGIGSVLTVLHLDFGFLLVDICKNFALHQVDDQFLTRATGKKNMDIKDYFIIFCVKGSDLVSMLSH